MPKQSKRENFPFFPHHHHQISPKLKGQIILQLQMLNWLLESSDLKYRTHFTCLPRFPRSHLPARLQQGAHWNVPAVTSSASSATPPVFLPSQLPAGPAQSLHTIHKGKCSGPRTQAQLDRTHSSSGSSRHGQTHIKYCAVGPGTRLRQHLVTQLRSVGFNTHGQM